MDTSTGQSISAALQPSTQGQQNLLSPVQRVLGYAANLWPQHCISSSHFMLYLFHQVVNPTHLAYRSKTLPPPSIRNVWPATRLSTCMTSHLALLEHILFACSQFVKTPKWESCSGHCLPLPELCNICKFYQCWFYVFLQVVDRKY